MAWSRLQSVANQVASGTTVTATYGSNMTSGSVMVVLTCQDTAGTVTVKDSHANTFTVIATVNLNGVAANGNLRLHALATPAADVPGPAALTATCTSSTNGFSILAQEISGIVATVDGTAGTSSGLTPATPGALPSAPAYTSHALNEFLVCCVGDPDNSGTVSTYTVPSGYTGDANNVNSSSNANCLISYKNSTNAAETGNYSVTSSSQNQYGEILVSFQLPAAGGPAGTRQPQPTFPLQRRKLVRAYIRGGTGTRAPAGSVQPQPTLTPPRRRLSRVLWAGGAGTRAPAGTVQPWSTIPVPRRKPARAVVQFTPVTTTNQVITGVAVPPPVELAAFPRRPPQRAYVRFTPVTTVNAGIPGQLQPWPTIPVPRRKPSRSVVEFTPVTTTNQVISGVAVPAPLMLARFPRKTPRRAFTSVMYRPVRTTNAPPPPFIPALSPTGAGGSIEGELWRMARDGDWPKRPPGFGPVGQVPASGGQRAEAQGRGWVGKKVRRFFWPREED